LKVITFSKSRVPSVEGAQWARLQQMLDDPEIGLMPHDVSNQTGLTHAAALAVILALIDDGAADGFWLIYHHCEDHPVAAVPFAEGFPHARTVCPACEDDALPGAFSYDVRAKLKDAVQLT
jgi:hypothetical protein